MPLALLVATTCLVAPVSAQEPDQFVDVIVRLRITQLVDQIVAGLVDLALFIVAFLAGTFR